MLKTLVCYLPKGNKVLLDPSCQQHDEENVWVWLWIHN